MPARRPSTSSAKKSVVRSKTQSPQAPAASGEPAGADGRRARAGASAVMVLPSVAAAASVGMITPQPETAATEIAAA